MPHNPAAAVRGPKHVVTKGKTPVLTPEETRQLLDSLQAETITGLRDRALIGLLVYTFARIGAAVALNVEDIYSQNRRHPRKGRVHGGPFIDPHHAALRSAE
jgi:integrase